MGGTPMPRCGGLLGRAETSFYRWALREWGLFGVGMLAGASENAGRFWIFGFGVLRVWVTFCATAKLWVEGPRAEVLGLARGVGGGRLLRGVCVSWVFALGSGALVGFGAAVVEGEEV